MAKLKLFQIFDTKEKVRIPGLYFTDKQVAKQQRRKLNEAKPNEPEQLRYIVVPGPDHRRYQE